MKQIFPITALWIASMGMASVVLIPSPPASAHPAQASPAAKDTIVTETILLKYMLPSQAVKFFTTPSELLSTDPSIGAKPKPPKVAPTIPTLPNGIIGTTPKDNDLSLTLKGTRRGVKEATALLRFLDVKPRQVQIKTRLIEIRLSEDGTKQEKLLQSPIVSTTNNVPAGVGLSFGNSTRSAFTTSGGNTTSRPNTSISVTPNINGDDSISLTVKLSIQPHSNEPVPSMDFTRSTRLKKQGEWHAFNPISLSSDKKINEALVAGAESAPASAYPLYRLEVSASEIIIP